MTTRPAINLNCEDPEIKLLVTTILQRIPTTASKYCSQVLHRQPPGTSTQTVTATAFATITSGISISTQTSGLATASTVITVTDTVGKHTRSRLVGHYLTVHR